MAGQEFTLLIAIEVFRGLAKMRKSQQEEVLLFFDQLESDPYGLSHYQDHDDLGNTRDVVIVADCAITYWVDYADKHVKVLRIEPAGS